jgi:hypothetical protein
MGHLLTRLGLNLLQSFSELTASPDSVSGLTDNHTLSPFFSNFLYSTNALSLNQSCTPIIALQV